MTDNRKTIRATIPAELVDTFDSAKKKAEEAAMISLTDTQYASRLIQYSLSRDEKINNILKAAVGVLGCATLENDNSVTVDIRHLQDLEDSLQNVLIRHSDGKFSI